MSPTVIFVGGFFILFLTAAVNGHHHRPHRRPHHRPHNQYLPTNQNSGIQTYGIISLVTDWLPLLFTILRIFAGMSLKLWNAVFDMLARYLESKASKLDPVQYQLPDYGIWN